MRKSLRDAERFCKSSINELGGPAAVIKNPKALDIVRDEAIRAIVRHHHLLVRNMTGGKAESAAEGLPLSPDEVTVIAMEAAIAVSTKLREIIFESESESV